MRIARAFAIAASLALATTTTGCGVLETSNGARVGQITKLSHKGFFPFCRTWEGQLAMANFRTGKDENSSNSFDFSVRDKAVLGKLQSAMDSGEQVKLTYREVMWPWMCSQDTSNVIDDVTPVRGEPSAPKFGAVRKNER